MKAPSGRASGWLVALAALCAAGVALWCAVYVPPDMDEFAPLHALACRYPFSVYHTFREACGREMLDFVLFRYERAYAYVGASSSILYYPFWRLLPRPASFYGLGAICLVLFAVSVCRTLRLNLRCAFVPLLFFPLVYLMIHDTGPIRLAVLSVASLAALGAAAVRDAARWRVVLYGVLAGVVVVVCVEDKPFYALLLPLTGLTTIGAIVAATRAPLREMARRAAPGLAAFAAASFLGVWVLLFVGHASDGLTYYAHLQAMADTKATTVGFQVTRILAFTFLPALSAHRVFGWGGILVALSLLPFVPTAVAMTYAGRAGVREHADRHVIFWLVAAYVAGVAVMLVTRVTSQPHHYIFLLLPVVVALMVVAGRSPANWTVIAGCLATSSLLSVAVLTTRHVQPVSARERDKVFAYLSRPEIGAREVINFSSWGGYYVQALYGDPAQLVTYTEPLNAPDAARLTAIAHSLGRGVVDVCMDCSPDAVAAAFGVRRVDSVDLGLARWRVFKVRGSADGPRRGD